MSGGAISHTAPYAMRFGVDHRGWLEAGDVLNRRP